MKIRRALRFMAFTLGVIFIAIAFSQVRWTAFLAALSSVKLVWVILSAASLFVAMYLRSMRWCLVSGLVWINIPKVWEAACIGYLGSVIYPARAGDVLRMLRLQQLTGMGGGLAIGSAVIDRILDGLALCCMVLVLVFAWGVGLEARQGLLGLAYLFLFAAAGAVAFVVSGHRLRLLFQRLSRLGKVGVRLSRWYDQCLDGLQVLRSPRHILRAFFLQGVVSLFDLLACWLLLHAFGWDLPFLTSMVVLVYIAAAVSLPSTPGYVGVYQVATLYALRPSGIENSAAVAYGTVLQVITLVLFVGVGIWAYLKQKSREHYLAIGT